MLGAFGAIPRHAELFRRFLDGVALVGRLDGADPVGLGMGPCRSPMRTAALAVGASFQDSASIGHTVKTAPPIGRCELHTLQGNWRRELALTIGTR
jgi:hypothetical protein